jgi:TonB-dependent SusC/RagA subfamily outer membrane receptor
VDGVVIVSVRPYSEFRGLDIERVEIIRGAAAAARYGPRAASGVIEITTKKGGGPATNH